MSFASDLRTIYHMVAKRNRGSSHAERMESFYADQAQHYDEFRRRLLQGREQLWQSITLPREGLTWVDLGGGTGSNLDNFGDEIGQLEKIYVVDLSTSLLERARQRVTQAGWSNVEVIEADATQFRPAAGYADVVTFSYSLTMIPDWMSALDNAKTMLRPGGQIGVVDFYVSRKHARQGHTRHGWLTRHGWPAWFATDNVFLSADHVPRLHDLFEVCSFTEQRAKVPYLPLFRVPYYTFVGEQRRT
jgi:S-adenosylmethionine-diacylgycerolhomoserine-N-methlytransferase